MGRLTQKEASGKWQVKGISWEELQEGKAVTEEMRRRLYGCLCKLKDYEDTGMSPQQMENRMNGMTLLLSKEGNAREYDDTYDIVIHCGSEEEQKKCRKMLKGMQWNPADESPEGESHGFLSFEDSDSREGDWKVDRKKYEHIQSRFSAKLKRYPNNKETAYNDGILACKSILKEVFEREQQDRRKNGGAV